jgi:hypothetical protein
MDQSTKSRDLPITDFYSTLQREYISYFVRSKIYPTEYAKKYENYCTLKRDKIEKIGLKNGLPSIFTLESIKNRYIDAFFNAFGLPNFEYRDDNSRKIMGKWDRVYYFGEGTSIKIKTDKSTIISIVDRNLYNINKVIVYHEGATHQFGYDFISRIIGEGILNF